MSLNEKHIIETLKTQFPEQIGDDAALFPKDEHTSYVITKDLLIENTHFRRSYQNARELAHKALHVNLSDLAAMGATPQFVLLGLAIPLNFEAELEDFLYAFASACKATNVILLGGDTTRAREHLSISITAIGTAKNTDIKLRKNAKLGDLLCVAGNIGHAHLGFTALEQQQLSSPTSRGSSAGPMDAADKPRHVGGGLTLEYKNAFLMPKARVAEGLWLGEQQAVHSMMDISDGLYIDLKRLIDASRLGCELNIDAFLPDEAFKTAAKTLNLDPIEAKLIGGEDYSLMFSVQEDAFETLSQAFLEAFQYPLKCIGKLHKGQNIALIKNNEPFEFNIKPFLHFGELLF